MKAKAYIETTVVSYRVARKSSDLLVAAHQALTVAWWDKDSPRFDLFVSEIVLQEAGSGDPVAAKRRLSELQGIPLLELNEEALELARGLLQAEIVPQNAIADALHVALASVHRMDYLVTWNCRHIANAEIMGRMAKKLTSVGYILPILCTPEQLMGQ